MQPRAVLLVLLCLVAPGCGRDRSGPPPPTAGSTTVPGPTTTEARLPTVTAEPIPDLDPAAFHSGLEKLGFSRSSPTTAPGFVTTTSQRDGSTVSTYGPDAADVVKIVAQADKAAAASVLPAVARSAVKGSDAGRAEAWVKAELKKKGPTNPSKPRVARATYGRQPYELIVNAATATLSIGRLTGGA